MSRVRVPTCGGREAASHYFPICLMAGARPIPKIWDRRRSRDFFGGIYPPGFVNDWPEMQAGVHFSSPLRSGLGGRFRTPGNANLSRGCPGIPNAQAKDADAIGIGAVHPR